MTPQRGETSDAEAADLEAFGQRLKELRHRTGLSLRQVAAEAGQVTASYLGVLEQAHNPKTKKPSRPTPDLILRLARTLGATFNESIELSKLAGYELSSAADHQAVANVLAMGRLPAVIGDLLQLETDLFKYVDDVPMVEAPVLTVLHHFEQAECLSTEPLFVTGQAFRARGEPARLFYPSERHADDNFHKSVDWLIEEDPDGADRDGRPLRIAVLGHYMTPTLLLLYRLRAANVPYKVNNSQRPDACFSSSEGEGEPVQIEVTYNSEAQATLLRYNQADLALMLHPFRQAEGTFNELSGVDLWPEYREAELPMSLVVTTPTTLGNSSRRTALMQRMDKVLLMYWLMYGGRVRDAKEALKQGAGFGRRMRHQEPVLEAFDDIYLDEPHKDTLCDSLSLLSNLGASLNVLSRPREADFYKQFLFTKSELQSEGDDRFTWGTGTQGKDGR